MSLFKGTIPIATNRGGKVKPPEDIQDKKVSFLEISDGFDASLSKISSGNFVRDIISGIKCCLKLSIRKEDVLTLEEIEASTNLNDMVASAQAVSRLNSEFAPIQAQFSYFHIFDQASVTDSTDLETKIGNLPENSFYIATLPSAWGMIIGFKSSDVYQKQINIDYWYDTIKSRRKTNSTTWTNWVIIS